MLDSAGRLRGAIDTLAEPRTGGFYSECLKIEKQTAWIWRAWDYFREKFDQRKDPRYRDTLLAADEVIWSCYRPFFRQPPGERVPEPAPLPYIEMEYSPVAVRRDQSSVIGGQPDDRKLIEEAFRTLPVPIMRLPVSAIRNPWVIALVGHETEHILQRMISSDPLRFVGAFRKAVENAAGNAAWSPWAVEIFADWYSVLTMGQWALHPIAQFGAGDAKQNARRGTVYPSLLVRLALMAELADYYGFPGAHALAKLQLERPQSGEVPDFDADCAAVAAVAAAIRNLPECQAVADQIGKHPQNYGPGGLASQWARHVGAGGVQPATRKPDSARLVAAGAVQAWDEYVFGSAEPPGDEAMEKLQQRTIDAMRGAGMPGVRSSSRTADAPAGALYSLIERVSRDD